MKILFSPSESKSHINNFGIIDENSFIFKELYHKRLYAVKIYNDYINSEKAEQLTDVFGIKDIEEIKTYQKNIFENKTCAAVKRYSGVSYNYLAFHTLNEKSQKYIYNNTLIFSNLFGPVLAGDHLPYYKLKQGAKIGSFVFEKYYKEHFSKSLANYLENDEVIDLRAGFYEKFYQIKKQYTTYKFIKGGKVVSHFSKAYRGILLRTAAINMITSNVELENNLPPSLEIVGISVKGIKREVVLNVKED